MFRRSWLAVASLVGVVLISAASHGAEITWSSAFEIEEATDLDISNEIVRAVNVADPTSVDFLEVDVDGTAVEFEPEHTFEFNSDLDFIFGSGGNVTGQGTFYSQDGLTTGNFDLDLVLDSHGWAGGGPEAAAAVLELQDLTVGDTYQIQLIGAGDDRGCCEYRQMQIWDEDENIATTADGEDLWFGRSNDFDEDDVRGPGSVIGTFTADQEIQSIFLVGTADFDDGVGNFGNGNDPGLSAYILSKADPGAGGADLNGDGTIDATDIDEIASALRMNTTDTRFDLNGDGSIDDADRVSIVKDSLNTWIGDANLDGEFNSGDFVFVFTGGEYEDGIDGNSGWAEGDWNGDGDFTSGDFVAAFTDGGYEQGPRAAVASVPEPSTVVLILMTLPALVFSRRR